MCGIFGMTLPRNYPADLIERGEALTFLGELAEERGLDSAGIAARYLTAERSPEEQWKVTKAACSFRQLAHRNHLSFRLADAQTAIGHTRWATQGSRTTANASPARAGSLLCTHNGDVDIDTIPYRPVRSGPEATDSSVLFAALATAHQQGNRVSVRRLVKILSSVRGRAALAWADISRPGGRVWLARAGLSPLAIGMDVDGGLWWASNPTWLRRLSADFGLPFQWTELIAEGTLLSATPIANTVTLNRRADFKPTIRGFDERLTTTAVWRGFTASDQHTDAALLHHRVTHTPLLAH